MGLRYHWYSLKGTNSFAGEHCSWLAAFQGKRFL